MALNEPTAPKSGPDLLRGGLDEADGRSRHHSRHTTRRAAGVVRQPTGEKRGAPLSRFSLRRRFCRCPPSVSAPTEYSPHCCVYTIYWALSPRRHFFSPRVYIAVDCCRINANTLRAVSGTYRRPNGGWSMPPNPYLFRFRLLPYRPDDESRAGLYVVLR